MEEQEGPLSKRIKLDKDGEGTAASLLTAAEDDDGVLEERNLPGNTDRSTANNGGNDDRLGFFREKDVGITQYINNSASKFSGVIKQRFDRKLVLNSFN